MWVCSRTPSRRASVGRLPHQRGRSTENGEQGATRDPEHRRRARGRGTGRPRPRVSARIVSRSCTTESGGRPPSDSARSIEPRHGWNRIPTSRAASISASSRSRAPRRGTRSGGPSRSCSPRAPARPGRPPPRPASTPRRGRAHIGYSSTSQPNNPPILGPAPGQRLVQVVVGVDHPGHGDRPPARRPPRPPPRRGGLARNRPTRSRRPRPGSSRRRSRCRRRPWWRRPRSDR